MRVLTLTTPDIENGLGYRLTIWFAGCSHHCPGCHNQHTWDYNQGIELTNSEVTQKIFNECEKEYIKGITLSGGDPLSQPKENLDVLYQFLKAYKFFFPNKDVWIYAGDTYEEIFNIDSEINKMKRKILRLCDVWIDGPYKLELKNPDSPFRGSSNQRIIDLKETFKENMLVNKKLLQ